MDSTDRKALVEMIEKWGAPDILKVMADNFNSRASEMRKFNMTTIEFKIVSTYESTAQGMTMLAGLIERGMPK